MNFIKAHKEIVASLVIIAVLAVLLRGNGVDSSMSMSMAANGMMLGGLALALAVVIGHVLLSKPRDERERHILTSSNSIAYVIGLVLLTIQIAVESLDNNLGRWAPFILASMIVSKLAASYIDRRK